MGYWFLKGDDVFKNICLKFIVNILEGLWIVKKVVGE